MPRFSEIWREQEGAIAQLVVHLVVAASSQVQNCNASVTLFRNKPSSAFRPTTVVKVQSGGGHYSECHNVQTLPYP